MTTTTTTRANRPKAPSAVSELLRALGGIAQRAFDNDLDHAPSPYEPYWEALAPAVEAVKAAQGRLRDAEHDLGEASAAVRAAAAAAGHTEDPQQVAEHLAQARLSLQLAEGCGAIVERRAGEHRAAVRAYRAAAANPPPDVVQARREELLARLGEAHPRYVEAMHAVLAATAELDAILAALASTGDDAHHAARIGAPRQVQATDQSRSAMQRFARASHPVVVQTLLANQGRYLAGYDSIEQIVNGATTTTATFDFIERSRAAE